MSNTKTIVAFHIGRGGRFNNQGHLSFIGEKKIGEFTDDLFLRYENESNFKDRYGYDSTGDSQRCILDLITDEDFFELEEKFGITEDMLGEQVYHDAPGANVGLTLKDTEEGIGRIVIDGQYDTTYTRYIEDCDENEIEVIRESNYWNKDELLEILEEIQNS